MCAFEDLTGHRYGLLVVVKKVGSDRFKKSLWECRCDCGNTIVISGGNVKRQISCRCVRLGARKHSMSKTRVYNIWKGVRNRCQNPNDSAYAHYGGRGIKLCEEWQDPRQFASDMGDPPKGYSIERIDVDGDYRPGNCEWIPRNQQNGNKRNTMIHEGMKVRDLAIKYGLTEDIVRQRIYTGVPMDHKAKPVENLITYDGLTLNQKQWAARLGIAGCTMSWRLRQGWPLEKALFNPTQHRR